MANFTYFDKLGNQITSGSSISEALEQSSLNYTVIKKPLFLEDGTLVKDAFCTLKDDDNTQLGVVGKQYTIVQNTEAFDFIDDVLEQSGGEIIRAGAFQDFKKSFVVVKTTDIEILGETYNPYLLFYNSFDGSGSIKACFTPVRVMCQNTIAYGFKKAITKVSIRHFSTAAERLTQAKGILLQNNQQLDLLKADSEELAKITLTKDQFKDQIVPLVLKEMKISKDSEEKKRNKDRYEQTANALLRAYDATDLGNHNNTAYKAIQAVADFESHVEPMKNAGNGAIYMGRVLEMMRLTTAARAYIADQVA